MKCLLESGQVRNKQNECVNTRTLWRQMKVLKVTVKRLVNLFATTTATTKIKAGDSNKSMRKYYWSQEITRIDMAQVLWN